MVEIYNYDVTTHERYAHDQKEVEAFQREYQLPTSATGLIAVQTKVLDFIPKHPAIALLMQTFIKKTWARFGIPEKFYDQRMLTSYVAPSLGPVEKQTADIQRVLAFVKQKTGGYERKERGEDEEPKSEEEKVLDEGDAIVDLLDKGVKQTNEMVDFVYARMHQFVQG